jgi:hypothetical protein
MGPGGKEVQSGNALILRKLSQNTFNVKWILKYDEADSNTYMLDLS